MPRKSNGGNKRGSVRKRERRVIFICTLICIIIIGAAYAIYEQLNDASIRNLAVYSYNETVMQEGSNEKVTNGNDSTASVGETESNINNKSQGNDDPINTQNKPEITSSGVQDQVKGVSTGEAYAVNVENAYASDGKKVAYLTFDDGPTDNITPLVLDVLSKYNIKATFFVIGKMAVANPDVLKRVLNEGHSIGNHTYSHDYKQIYISDASLIGEVKKTEQAMQGILGQDFKTRLFRFPGGSFESYKKQMVPVLNENGYHHIDWNTVNGDEETKNPTAEWLTKRVKETSGGKNKIVVLMHDSGNKQETLKALPGIIEFLISEGYEFKALK